MSLKVEFCKKRGMHWEMCEEDVTPRGQISLDGSLPEEDIIIDRWRRITILFLNAI